jgi:DNA-binding transcriptional ArsR family regulator
MNTNETLPALRVDLPNLAAVPARQKEHDVPDESDLTQALEGLAAIIRAPKIVRYLVDNPESYYGQIREDMDQANSSLARHLGDLEAHGIIRGDIPAERRRGRAVRYHVDVDRVEWALSQIRISLLE